MGASPYTKERLEEAARASGTLSEALEGVGVVGGGFTKFDAALCAGADEEAGGGRLTLRA